MLLPSMSTCSIHNGNFPESNDPFNEGRNLQETPLAADTPEILQQTVSKNNEELKRMRNRLAQRKHRQRRLRANLVFSARRHTYLTYVLKTGKKAEEQGNSGDLRETRSKKLSAANNRVVSIQKEKQNGRLPTFVKDVQRYRTGSFRGQQES
jgi:hypothetical protein